MSDKPTTKDTILDAAETVVARDGSRHMTIEAVAAEANISKGGVLYHYPNKMALLQAMVTRMVTAVRDDIHRAEREAEAAGEPALLPRRHLCSHYPPHHRHHRHRHLRLPLRLCSCLPFPGSSLSRLRT